MIIPRSKIIIAIMLYASISVAAQERRKLSSHVFEVLWRVKELILKLKK